MCWYGKVALLLDEDTKHCMDPKLSRMLYIKSGGVPSWSILGPYLALSTQYNKIIIKLEWSLFLLNVQAFKPTFHPLYKFLRIYFLKVFYFILLKCVNGPKPTNWSSIFNGLNSWTWVCVRCSHF